MSILFTKRLLKTLGKVDQELQGTYMSIVLIKCLLKKPYQKSPESSRKVGQELQGGCISIVLTKCLSKA